MNFVNSISVAWYELKHSVRIFLLYSVIFVPLMAVSAALINSAVYLPDEIFSFASELNADRIYLISDSTECVELISDKAELYDCYAENNDTDLFSERYSLNIGEAGVLIDDNNINNLAFAYLSQNIITGSLDLQYECDCIWIDDDISEKTGLKSGEILKCYGTDEEEYYIEVKGVFKSSQYFKSYYYSMDAYRKSNKNEDPLIYEMRCSNFSQMNSIIDTLDKNSVVYSCNNDLFHTMRIMYSAFYSSGIILIFSLSGIVISMIDMYLSRRIGFYSVNHMIGMRKKDIMFIIFLISEMVILICSIISPVFSFFIVKQINTYVSQSFDSSFNFDKISFQVFVFVFLLTQLSVIAAVLLKKRKIFMENYTVILK